MKIGILTFHRAHNYGALLQLYSLKSFLTNNNHDIDIIDYWPKYHSSEYLLFPSFFELSFKSKIKNILIFIFDFYRILKRRYGYLSFIKHNLDLKSSVKFINKDEIIIKNYDIIIYGSDQIWRKHNLANFKDFDDIYFGNIFPKSIKKISYAASMGEINLTFYERSMISKYLLNFDYISVRELSLKNEFINFNNLNIEIVLDPVFLFDKSTWVNKFSLSKMLIKKKYIFLYQLLNCNDSLILTSNAADHFSCDIIEIPGTTVNSFLWSNRYCQTASPIEFLNLIYNADCIISTSFHGVAFAIIFEKQFYALGMKNNSSRVKDLLNSLSLNDRYVDNVNNVDFSISIDYEQVNNKLSILKDNSISFLKKSIKS